jgi:hypothetical protein
MSIGFQIVNNSGDLATGSVDIALDAVGRMVQLTGKPKLIQDIQKILYTELNKFYSQYKTLIDDVIGTAPNPDDLKLLLAQRVTNSLNYLQQLQQQQAKYQNVDASEIIQTINSIGVTYGGDLSSSGAALTTYSIEISVSNAFQENVNVTAVLGGS